VHNVFTARDKDLHRSKRNIIAPALTERAVKAFEPTLLEQIDIYLKLILENSRGSQPVNMSDNIRRLALDIVGKLCFGYPLATQTSEENRFVSTSIAAGLARGYLWHHVFILSRIWLFKIFYGSREKYTMLLNKMIKTRIARGADGPRDFYSFLTDPTSNGGERKIPAQELWWEAHFLLVAG
jgi:cytochrome P450